jgi:hypothetical protein
MVHVAESRQARFGQLLALLAHRSIFKWRTYDSLFQRVRHERQDLRALIQQQHRPEITQPLVAEPRAGDELEAFDLTEMGRVTEHMDVKQLSDVVVSHEGVAFLERRSDRRRFDLDERPFIGERLGLKRVVAEGCWRNA